MRKLLILVPMTLISSTILVLTDPWKIKNGDEFRHLGMNTEISVPTNKTSIARDEILNEKKESEEDSPHLFVDRRHFFEELHKAMYAWRKKRGYHIEDDFSGYLDLNEYNGQHPYGYLKESELAALAEEGDVDAQIIYSYYYLKKTNPDKAFETFESIVVNTNQTAPLGSMGVFIITGNANKDQFPDQRSREDEASAIFYLMKERHDPLGDHYLKMAKFDSFDLDRQESIKQRAADIAAEYAELRDQKGLGPYEDEIFDGAQAMNMPKDVFDRLYADYKKQSEKPSDY